MSERIDFKEYGGMKKNDHWTNPCQCHEYETKDLGWPLSHTGRDGLSYTGAGDRMRQLKDALHFADDWVSPSYPPAHGMIADLYKVAVSDMHAEIVARVKVLAEEEIAITKKCLSTDIRILSHMANGKHFANE